MLKTALTNRAVERGRALDDAESQTVVAALVKRVGIRLVGAQAAKFVPILGQAVAASISFGAMKLAGDRHADDCYETAKRTLLAPALPSA